jgi:ABC-type dipeptide/oligopeptide/nickel transport system ATPase component
LLGAAATFLLETTDLPAMATFADTAVVMDKADIIRKGKFACVKECDV